MTSATTGYGCSCVSEPLNILPGDQLKIENNMENLMDGLFKEMNRCRELLKEYEAIGPVGIFGSTLIKAEIAAAENAIKNGDIVQMVEAYKLLSECK